MYSAPVRFIDTVGFTFQGDNLGLGCTANTVRHILATDYPQWPVMDTDTVHDLVATLARAKREGIMYPHDFDTYDTATFDSGDIPKAFESGSLEDDEKCMSCWQDITDCR